MKKINTDGQLTVKEFLQLEDGYYNLENPIEYVIEGSKHEPEPLLSETYSISHQDNSKGGQIYNFDGNNPTKFVPQDGISYHIKLEFASGFISEGDIEAENRSDLGGSIFSLYDILDDLQPEGHGYAYICMTGDGNKVRIDIRTLANAATNQSKYGDTLNITVTEQDDGKVKPDCEISGVITVHTDVKVLSGLMKIVTTCANDISYYIDNVWQDGEILEVSAKDEESGSGGGESGGGSYSFVKILDNYNGKFSTDKSAVAYGEPTKTSVAMAAMKDIVDSGRKILGFTLDSSNLVIFLSNVCVRKPGPDGEYISFIAHQDDAEIYDFSTYNTLLFFIFNVPDPVLEKDVNFTASVYAICAD